MAQQTINIGTIANDGTGDTLRDAGDKINDNFTELYTGLVGLLDFKGSQDCSANPNYPAASKGDFYLVSVAGKIGGASGVVVSAGDTYFALADNAGGTQASVGTSWTVIQGNVAFTPVNIAGDTMTGDLIVPDEAYDATAWNGSLEVPTKNAVRDKIEALIAGSASVSDTVYGAGWNGDTTVAPSKNAVYDKIEALAATIPAAYAGGVQSVPILASAMTARTTNGAAAGSTETTTNKVMLPTLDFDASTIEYAQFLFPMPKSWNEGTVTAKFIWTAASGSGDVIWGLQAIAISEADPLDVAFGTAQEVTDSLTTALDNHTSSATSAITVGGTPQPEDLVAFQVYRKASDGSDTLAVDAKLLAVVLNITTNAADDS